VDALPLKSNGKSVRFAAIFRVGSNAGRTFKCVDVGVKCAGVLIWDFCNTNFFCCAYKLRQINFLPVVIEVPAVRVVIIRFSLVGSFVCFCSCTVLKATVFVVCCCIAAKPSYRTPYLVSFECAFLGIQLRKPKLALVVWSVFVVQDLGLTKLFFVIGLQVTVACWRCPQYSIF